MRRRGATTSAAAGASLCAVAALVLLAWALDGDALRALAPRSVATNPLSALCFAALGSALLRATRGTREQVTGREPAPVPEPTRSRDPVLLALAGAVALAALPTLLAYVGGPDAGLDLLLFRNEVSALDPPNRMAPNTALAFLAAAFGLVLVQTGSERAVVAGQLAALGTGLAGLITTAGYVFGLRDLMGAPSHVPMALTTALAFVVAATGILLSRTDAGLVAEAAARTPGGQMFRRTATAAVLLPPLLAWLAVRAVGAGVLGVDIAISIAVIAGTLLLVAVLGRNARRLDRADAARAEADRRTRGALRELSLKSAELAAANEELSSFSYSVSHDLRAPLRSINSFGRILSEEHAAALSEEARSHLARIVRAGARMSGLIDDLIELARVSRGELDRTEVDVSAIAHDVVEELHGVEPLRWVDVAVEPGLEAWADPRLVRVALANLIGNAWKYSSRVEEPRVEVGALPPSGNGGAAATGNGDGTGAADSRALVFYVRDNGVGFDMSHAGRLFTPFQRLHAQEEYDGTGVGLATVRRVVHRHGGEVWAEAAPGAGATFYFTLNPGDGDGATSPAS